MRMQSGVLLACGLVSAASLPAHAGEEHARRVVEKAVHALGGEARLVRNRAVSARGTGMLHLGGEPIPCSLRIVYQPPAQYVLCIEGPTFKSATVLNGKRGWVKLNRAVGPMSRAQVVECIENLHVEEVVCLVPLLKNRAFTLTPLPEVLVDSKPAIGVKVTCKGRPDVKLYFDRKTSLLVKTESAVKENRSLVNQEIFYSNYADVNGTMRPNKVTTVRDGKPHATWNLTEHKLFEERLRDIEFSKP